MAVTSAQRSAAAWLAIGLVLLVVAQLAAPIVTAPLYDGVTVIDHYRYLNPPPGQPGDPTVGTSSDPLDQGQSPQIFAATQENPPQAQLIADVGAFVVPPDSTTFNTTVQPVSPPAVLPNAGQIAGNVYRLTVTNQAGAPARIKAGVTATFVLRAPIAIPNAQIAIFNGSAWQQLPTISGGLPELYAANIAELGDYAVIAPAGSSITPPTPGPFASQPTPLPLDGSPPTSGGGPNPALFVVIGVVLGVALLGVWELWQRRGPPPRPPTRPLGRS